MGLVLHSTNLAARQTLFGHDVTACFGKPMQREPTPMHVAGRELVVIRIKVAPAGNIGTGPKAPTGENAAKADPPAAGSGAELRPKSIASGYGGQRGEQAGTSFPLIDIDVSTARPPKPQGNR
jgi:hypothetical protein